MATENLKLTADIIISHASMTELSTQELLKEIKSVYNLLASWKVALRLREIMGPEKRQKPN